MDPNDLTYTGKLLVQERNKVCHQIKALNNRLVQALETVKKAEVELACLRAKAESINSEVSGLRDTVSQLGAAFKASEGVSMPDFDWGGY